MLSQASSGSSFIYDPFNTPGMDYSLLLPKRLQCVPPSRMLGLPKQQRCRSRDLPPGSHHSMQQRLPPLTRQAPPRCRPQCRIWACPCTETRPACLCRLNRRHALNQQSRWRLRQQLTGGLLLGLEQAKATGQEHTQWTWRTIRLMISP